MNGLNIPRNSVNSLFLALLTQSLHRSSAHPVALPCPNSSLWFDLLGKVRQQGLLGVLYPVCAMLPKIQAPSTLCLLPWFTSVKRLELLHRNHMEALRQLIAVLESQQLKFYMLNGEFLSSVYPQGILRNPEGLDLYFFTVFDYFRAIQWAKSTGSLLQIEMGSLSFSYQQTVVRFHQPCLGRMSSRTCRYIHKQIQEQGVVWCELPSVGNVRSLSPCTSFIYLIALLRERMIQRTLRLSHVVDIVCFIRSHPVFPVSTKEQTTALLVDLGYEEVLDVLATILVGYLGFSSEELPFYFSFSNRAHGMLCDVFNLWEGQNKKLPYLFLVRKGSQVTSNIVVKCGLIYFKALHYARVQNTLSGVMRRKEHVKS